MQRHNNQVEGRRSKVEGAAGRRAGTSASRVFIFVCFGLMSGMIGAPRSANAQEKIAAIVNSEVITLKDIAEFGAFMRMQLSQQYQGRQLEEKLKDLQGDMLQKLVEDRLIIQEARALNVKIDESRVKARLNELKKRYPSNADFQNELMSRGLSQADIERKIREQFLMYSIIEEKIRGKIIVQPDEVTQYYNEHVNDLRSEEQREVDAVIMDDEENIRAAAHDLRRGQTVKEAAVRYPQATLHSMSVVRGKDLKPDVEEQIFALKEGGVTEPIVIEDKYYVFKVNAVIPARQRTLSEVQDAISEYLFDQRMQAHMKKWLDDLKEKSYIKTL